MSSLHGFGLGIVSVNAQGETLDTYYPAPIANVNGDEASALREVSGRLDARQLRELSKTLSGLGNHALAAVAVRLAETSQPVVATPLPGNASPTSVEEAYLKLHLISHRLVRPHETDLSDLFGLLPNVAWTELGPVDLRELPQKQLDARLRGEVLEVSSVDKFPKMTNYVVPTGVRIAHTARVRLGAYLGEGTTVMHEGFINFNAGTEGPGMIEGRISAGVWVGRGSDLGGGCSTMGTLSGGGSIVISVGKECLIGANAGLGIPLGDRCTIEAGLFITAGTKVSVLDSEGNTIETVPARSLAGQPDLLFRRHSTTGSVQCLTNKSAIALNEMLHANN